MARDGPGTLPLRQASLSSLLLALCCCLDVALAATASCVPSPVPMRVGDVTLSNKQTTRGIEVSVGSPAEAMAFIPRPINNTLVWGTSGFCDVLHSNWSTSACTTFRGGAYDPVSSTTRTTANSGAYPVDSSPFGSVSVVADTLAMGNSTTLSNFPISVPLNDFGEQGYATLSGFGLGSNSTILSTLKSAGHIASRSWSLFWGHDNPSATKLDGSFIFGGYDKAKTSGNRYSYDISPPTSSCPSGFLVTVTDIVLNFANGTSASIFTSSQSSAMSSCLNPSQQVALSIPRDPYLLNFGDMTGLSIDSMLRTYGLYWFNMRYPDGSTPYTGDVSVKLTGGLSVRIPNNQLVMPDQQIDGSTGERTVNSTGPDLAFDSMQDVNKNDLAQLGIQFLTAAYLIVNQDTNQFHLYSANPTADTDIVALDATGAEFSTFCDATSSNTSTTSPDANSSGNSTATDSNQSAKSSTGTIAGATVGAVAGVAALAAFGFWFWRRRNAQKIAATQPNMIQYEQVNSPNTATATANTETAYKPAEWYPPQELPNEPAHPPVRYELS